MKFKIEVVELEENGSKYPTEKRLYSQIVDNIQLEKFIIYINTTSIQNNYPQTSGLGCFLEKINSNATTKENGNVNLKQNN